MAVAPVGDAALLLLLLLLLLLVVVVLLLLVLRAPWRECAWRLALWRLADVRARSAMRPAKRAAAFGPHALLGVEPEATADEVRRAYTLTRTPTRSLPPTPTPTPT